MTIKAFFIGFYCGAAALWFVWALVVAVSRPAKRREARDVWGKRPILWTRL